MDFFNISVTENKDGEFQISPDFVVVRTRDLMVRGKGFYAIWDQAQEMWSRDEYDVQRLVDEELYAEKDRLAELGQTAKVQSLRSFSSQKWMQFRRFMQHLSDNSHELDERLTFANTDVSRDDYVSRRLPYSLERGDTSNWDQLLDTLYDEEDRDKIEWAIGSIVTGDSRHLQKFFVFYGPAGTGKSTILNIIGKMFVGYVAPFDAKALGSSNAAFATEAFKTNPLVAIQHDGDLSKIESNTMINSIVSHEDIVINEKYRPGYSSRINAILLMGTNQPVKITDAKSGLIRRLIDIHPSGRTLDPDTYHQIMARIDFEFGAIAQKCADRYHEMGKNYYSGYRPEKMMQATDMFYNFVEAHYGLFNAKAGISLKHAYELYKNYCHESGIDRYLPQFKFKTEFANYFEQCVPRYESDSEIIYNLFLGFKLARHEVKSTEPPKPLIDLEPYDPVYVTSAFQKAYPDAPAQYAGEDGNPEKKWANVHTILEDLNERRLHFVQIPEQHIVIDFDLTNEAGEKDLDVNLAAAAQFPPTYTETSKSGNGVHLHYIWDGDVSKLASVYDVGIEVKTLLGNASLRRRLSACNDLDIRTISSGLPLKEDKKMIDDAQLKTEKALRKLIVRNLRKEIHPGTKPSIDFIHKILEDAYAEGFTYDVSDMIGDITTFAALSTHQADTCLKVVKDMKFVSASEMEEKSDDGVLVFYDIEVYSNLFVVCWEADDSEETVRMINPGAQEIGQLLEMNLVGFNNRRYDNHILYARYMGASIEELYALSQRIINNDRSAMFGAAYGLSHADIYDYSSEKKSLKKFEIDLGINHMEMDIPWDEPVPDDRIDDVVEYCVNDVKATKAVHHHRAQDYAARVLLSQLSGLPVNSTTQNHTAQILFGTDKKPQDKFKYTDLSEMFPGYEFDGKESTYRGEVTGEGGYVYAEPGIHHNVALLDVASMHPTSIELLDLFGVYTPNYSAIKEARMAIKHGEYEQARVLLDGRLVPFLEDVENNPGDAEALSYALKIVINTVYGLTSARFDNPFRDRRNKDNIVAKRGALFMVDLKHALQELGVTVAHIKTDSVKIPDATPEIIEFVTEFGAKYGYTFEHEATYERLALVNEAVYIAWDGKKWSATGAQFAHPYVYKTLFAGEGVDFDDLCEARSVVKGVMYLDFSENGGDDGMVHVGRTGSFVPVLEGGGRLLRVNEEKQHAVTGTKDYRWIERNVAEHRNETSELMVDMSYFEHLADAARKSIGEFGDFEEFVRTHQGGDKDG